MTSGRGMYGCVLVCLVLVICSIPALFPRAVLGQDITVAVVESRRIKAYDLALDGFKEVMARRGYTATFVRYVVDVDLHTPDDLEAAMDRTGAAVILALGTDAAKLVKEAHTAVPTVFSMVSEPGQSGLLNAGTNGGSPMTGVCLDVPVETQFSSLLDVVPRASKIGVVYNPDESQFIVDAARSAANRMNLGLVTYPVHSEAEVPEALTALRPRIDALWLVSDRMVLTTQSLQYVFLFTFQTNLPLMGLSEHFVKMGALCAVGPDYRDIGMQSGEFAVQILGGRDPEELPMAAPRKVLLSLNLRTAEIIGLRIPEGVIRQASSIY
ncbi:MAG: ABC transporter substrate-binding protein [Candidatus Eisenbacteria bacterium]